MAERDWGISKGWLLIDESFGAFLKPVAHRRETGDFPKASYS